MKTRILLLLALGLLSILNACSRGDETNVSVGTKLQILHRGNGEEPQDLDPHVVTGMPEHRIFLALLEGLVAKDPKDLSIVPGVAESWTISEDQLTYTFHLRSEAKWSNGEKLTAHDFVYSWRRALMPALGNQYVYMLFYIKNAKRFHLGEVTNFKEVGVKALDDQTLRVELESPTPFFLQLLDHYSYYPVHPPTIEKFGGIDRRGSRWTRQGNFVGNGPFTLKEWVLNRILVVEKNPFYWDADIVRLNEIRFYPVQNYSTEERMFRTGQLHITQELPADKVAVYREKSPETLNITPYLGTYFYRLNTTFKPLDDTRVRRALAMTIDREQIVKKITKAGQIPAYTLTPPNTNGYTARSSIPYDIEKAKALLAEAGYPDGKNFPTLTLLYNTSETHRKIAIAVQQMWKKTLNIDITLENQDWKVYLENESNMNYVVSRAAWIGDYLDPNTFLDMFVTGGGNNRTGWSSPEYDALIAKAAVTANQTERFAIFQQAEQILTEEVPIIPIYTYTRNHLLSTDVKGWPPNILDHHPYKNVYLSSD